MAEIAFSGTSRRNIGRAADPLRRIRRTVRGALLKLLALGSGDGSEPPPDLHGMRRILLVHVNQRLGNTLLATVAVAALAAALPGAQISVVGGRPAVALLRGFRLSRVRTLGRFDPWKPWRLVPFVLALRRESYDAAIHLSTATGSLGALLVAVSGARHKIGVRREDGNVFFTTALEPPQATHKVDQLLELLAQLGIESAGERTLALAPDERAAAVRSVEDSFGKAGAPVALFVGSRARKGKSWPLACYAAVADGLRAQGIPLLVFLGPEELPRQAEIRAALGAAEYVYEPDVRRVGALLGACRAVLAPDAGPMHLAIAAGAPTVALFTRPNFDRWGPRPPRGVVVYDPDGTRAGEALDAVLKIAAA
jgi:ADP-heptose:LPS heptosyltransferase